MNSASSTIPCRASSSLISRCSHYVCQIVVWRTNLEVTPPCALPRWRECRPLALQPAGIACRRLADWEQNRPSRAVAHASGSQSMARRQNEPPPHGSSSHHQPPPEAECANPSGRTLIERGGKSGGRVNRPGRFRDRVRMYLRWAEDLSSIGAEPIFPPVWQSFDTCWG